MTIFQLKYGTAKLLFDSPIFKKFKGDGCYSYSLLLFYFYFIFKKSGSEERLDCGEIIRFTWWTSDVVHHSTKKLSHV